MDFLTTLLAYMAASLVVAVESTSTPSVTPVPTPAPTPEDRPAVVETVTGLPSAAATAVPTATVSVTPEPVPTITPNTAAYHNLGQGDRGNEVRRLQERLIELGYLPEGAADGAYGGQTRMAVRRFQYYNGLTVDGIAGRTTQTNLFENPQAARYPGETTPEPEGEASPAPEGTDAGTAEPTNTPVPTDTPVPTVTPVVVAAQHTEAPKTEETAEPEAKASEEPSAEPSAEPAAEETAAPEARESAEPSAEPGTEEPAEPEEPAEETASPAVPEIEESVDLDRAEETAAPVPAVTRTPAVYTDLAGWIVLNDSGENMQWTEMEDGVPVIRSPRLQRSAEGEIRVSLDDLSKSVEGWNLAEEEHSVVLEAEGYTLALLNEEAGFVSTVDGIEMVTDGVDFSFDDGHFLPVDFLTRALDGSWEWDEEEETLMLRIPPKTGYTD